MSLDSHLPAGRQHLVATLHPDRRGLRYGVSFYGEMIVRDSRDPDFDLARALKARGFYGSVVLVDANTEKPRTIVTDIDKAAAYCTREGPLRFEKLSLLDGAPAGEAKGALWKERTARSTPSRAGKAP